MLKKDVVGADHEFHDKEFALGWAERFVPTPERLRLFDTILFELRKTLPDDARILELGIGPGYLASHVLASMPAIQYFGIDFSEPMLQIAKDRLASHSSRVTYKQTDLINDTWENDFSYSFDAIVSTWSLHDLGSQKNIGLVYEKSARALADTGVLLNGDFIKPERAIQEFEPGRFEIAKHLVMLRNAGYSTAECIEIFEEEIESPTPAQNYACIKATK